MYGHACSSPRRSVFSGGAKARMTEVEGVRLPSVVRRLRTTDCKRTRSNSTVCAFAPPEKTLRRGLSRVVRRLRTTEGQNSEDVATGVFG